jgi:putative DNA primase/helicase
VNIINLADAENQIQALGIVLDKPLQLDGRIQRWKTTESKGNDKPGWTRLREWQSRSGHSYVVGAFGVWQGNDDGRLKIELPKGDDPAKPVLSDEDIAAARAAQKAAQKALDEERKREQKIAAGWAGQVWAHAKPAVEHEYLARKAIKAHGTRILEDLEGLLLPDIDDGNWWRLTQAKGALVVPMHDVNGNVCGLQFIYPKGHARAEAPGKEFWPAGMGMAGTFGNIGGFRRSGVLLAGEGFATMATAYEATGIPVIYAFSANNLGKAAKQVRAKYKQLRILVLADDDQVTEQKTGTNPGVTAAQFAASEIESAAWMKPDFLDEDGNDRRGGKKLSDFNDLAQLTGLPILVSNQINAKLDEIKWRTPSTAAGSSQQGGGDDGGRRRAQSVMALDAIVERFLPVDDGTGKYVFDTWTNKIAHREQMITLLPAGVRGDDIKRHPVWIDRGAYFLDEVGFDPTGADKRVRLNTWKGWPMQPQEGSCDRLLELIQYLCSADVNARDACEWMLNWMAYPLQNPGAKMSSAIIMHGPQGTGKSTVFQTLAKIYGDYATVLNQRGLEDKFNSDWADSKLFILAEEVVTRAEMWHIKNELKELVTGEWIRINPKNIAAYRQRNQINICYLSNENQPLPLDNDDRRHLVIYTPPALGEDFYDEVQFELEHGGVAAFYSYLLQRDLGKFHPKKRPPMTEAKTKLIALSSPSEYRFVHEWSSGELGLPVCPALASDVYAAYIKWCRDNGEVRPRASNQFHGALDRMPGWEKKKARIFENATDRDTVPKPIVFPPQALLEQCGTACQPAEAQAKYLTRCVADFTDKLQAMGRNGERMSA